MQIDTIFDTLEQLNGVLLQHGNAHNRVYVTNVENKEDWTLLLPKIEHLAKSKRYHKILGRVPEEAKEHFETNGYKVEAKIPGLYNGQKDGYFLADYLEKERGTCSEQELRTIASVKTIAKAASGSSSDSYFELPKHFEVRKLISEDYATMVRLHGKAFKSYAFPINKVAYIKELAENDHEFYGLFKENELLVSTILKIQNKEASIEIADFATHPDYRGQNLSYYVLQKIMGDMDQSAFKTIYSLVRATSYGLNITFSKHGFFLGGTLLKNTQIDNRLESMNVWYANN